MLLFSQVPKAHLDIHNFICTWKHNQMPQAAPAQGWITYSSTCFQIPAENIDTKMMQWLKPRCYESWSNRSGRFMLVSIHTLFSWAFHGLSGINIFPSTSLSTNTASFNLVAVDIPLLRPVVFICRITVQELGGNLSRLEVPMLFQNKECDAHKEENATWRACWSNIWIES